MCQTSEDRQDSLIINSVVQHVGLRITFSKSGTISPVVAVAEEKSVTYGRAVELNRPEPVEAADGDIRRPQDSETLKGLTSRTLPFCAG